MPQYDFAILGAGALGSILGAHLARAGHSVVMLVRERRDHRLLPDVCGGAGVVRPHARRLLALVTEGTVM